MHISVAAALKVRPCRAWGRLQSASAAPPAPSAVPARVRRVRGCLLRNQFNEGGFPPAKGLPFGTRARRFSVPLRAAAAHYGQLVWPRSSTAPWAPGSDAIAGARQGPTQRASWISGHPSFQDAGRLHVNVGWRHPRPVAANGRSL